MNIFSVPFSLSLSSPSGTPIIMMLVHLTLSQSSLRLSLFLFNLFSLFCPTSVISTSLSSTLLIRSSASYILLLVASKEFFISVVVFCTSTCLIFFVFLPFLGPHLRHMEAPRPGVQSELQPLAYARATAMPDLSHIHDPHHNSWHRWILNPPSKVRDQTHNLMVPCWIC